MRDGAGNTGPVRVRLQNVFPALNVRVTDDPNRRCSDSGAPYACFELLAEFCMDAVSNPGNSVLLQSMQIDAVFSPDGVSPITRGGFPLAHIVGSNPRSVTPGSCVTAQTQPGDHPPFPHPSEGVPRYLMLVASYGAAGPLSINQAACPSPEEVATTPGSVRPLCAFRRVYDLGYHF